MTSGMVATWMRTAGQTVRDAPTADIPRKEAHLRARLVLSEALEFVEAMGFSAEWSEDELLNEGFELIDTKEEIDLVEAADALADLRVVVFGSECTLGLPGALVFAEVMRSNWTKFPGGVAQFDNDGKVIKPDTYQKPVIAPILGL